MQTASRHPTGAKRGSERRRLGWWLPLGIGVGSIALLTTTALLVFPRFLNTSVVQTSGRTDITGTDTGGSSISSSSDATDASSESGQKGNGKLVRIGTYPPGPRLPGTTEFLERDFIGTVPWPISDYVKDVPPDVNVAPKLLETLTPLLGELAVCYPETAYPDSKRATITRIGTKNQQHIKQWHAEFKTSGKLPDPSKLDAFDGLYQDLDGLTRQTRHSFLLVPEMDHVMPHLQAIQVLAQLTVLRFHSRKDSSSIGDRIAELGSVLRLLKIFEDQYIIGNIVCRVSRDLAHDSIASDIIHNQDLSESSGLQLLLVLDESATYKDSIQLSRVIRSEQIRASRFFYDLEKGSGAVESLMEVMSSLGTQSAGGSKQQEQLTKLTLSKMSVAQIRHNRDEYNRDAERVLAFLDSDRFEQPDAVDPFLEQHEQREQERRAWQQGFRQLKTVEAIVEEMVKHTWLTELVRPSHEAIISNSVRAIARRRVLIATLALRIASLQKAGESESLQELFKRLNITESPIDPYSGQPLKTIQRNGVKIAYSVGSDRTDDRAAATDTNGYSPGDIFFDATAR